MFRYLDYPHGKAFVAYDTGDEGMLSVEGFDWTYHVGDKINRQLDSDADVFEIFTGDPPYSQDYN